VRRLAPAGVAFGAVSLVSIISVAAIQQPKTPYPPAKPMALASPATSAKRGEQLVQMGGCNDCHTPKLANGQIDARLSLSGHPANAPLPAEAAGSISTNLMLTAWRGPWGLSLTANLTPDRETGIGAWTLADFKKTMRTGVDPQGKVLMPPMPVQGLQNLPDQDLEAMYNYLRTIKPIRNAVGRVTPPAPARK
jgi:cytochrome c551/c552